MTAPSPYDRQYSFSAYQAGHPSDPLPGDEVDAEFDAVRAAMDETQAALADIRRDDGELANESVGYEQLKSELSVGVSPAVPWAADTAFAVNDMVFYNFNLYRVITAHTSTDSFDATKFTASLADLSSITVAPGSIDETALADDAVTEDKINDGAVTPGKISGLPGSALLGRYSSSSGGLQYVTIGSGLEFDDNVLNCTIDGSSIPDGAVGTDQLADGAVTTAKAVSGFAVSSLGFTPVNRAGDSNISGVLQRNGQGAHIWHGGTYTSGKVTVSASAPSGGSDGDIWLQTS